MRTLIGVVGLGGLLIAGALYQRARWRWTQYARELTRVLDRLLAATPGLVAGLAMMSRETAAAVIAFDAALDRLRTMAEVDDAALDRLRNTIVGEDR